MGLLTGARVAAVERADPDGKSQVVGCLPWCQLEIFGCDTPHAHPPRGDLRSCESFHLGDTLGRSIDHQYVPITDPLGHSPCRGTRRTADLEYPHALSKREGIDDIRKAR